MDEQTVYTPPDTIYVCERCNAWFIEDPVFDDEYSTYCSEECARDKDGVIATGTKMAIDGQMLDDNHIHNVSAVAIRDAKELDKMESEVKEKIASRKFADVQVEKLCDIINVTDRFVEKHGEFKNAGRNESEEGVQIVNTVLAECHEAMEQIVREPPAAGPGVAVAAATPPRRMAWWNVFTQMFETYKSASRVVTTLYNRATNIIVYFIGGMKRLRERVADLVTAASLWCADVIASFVPASGGTMEEQQRIPVVDERAVHVSVAAARVLSYPVALSSYAREFCAALLNDASATLDRILGEGEAIIKFIDAFVSQVTDALADDNVVSAVLQVGGTATVYVILTACGVPDAVSTAVSPMAVVLFKSAWKSFVAVTLGWFAKVLKRVGKAVTKFVDACLERALKHIKAGWPGKAARAAIDGLFGDGNEYAQGVRAFARSMATGEYSDHVTEEDRGKLSALLAELEQSDREMFTKTQNGTQPQTFEGVLEDYTRDAEALAVACVAGVTPHQITTEQLTVLCSGNHTRYASALGGFMSNPAAMAKLLEIVAKYGTAESGDEPTGFSFLAAAGVMYGVATGIFGACRALYNGIAASWGVIKVIAWGVIVGATTQFTAQLIAASFRETATQKDTTDYAEKVLNEHTPTGRSGGWTDDTIISAIGMYKSDTELTPVYKKRPWDLSVFTKGNDARSVLKEMLIRDEDLSVSDFTDAPGMRHWHIAPWTQKPESMTAKDPGFIENVQKLAKAFNLFRADIRAAQARDGRASKSNVAIKSASEGVFTILFAYLKYDAVFAIIRTAIPLIRELSAGGKIGEINASIRRVDDDMQKHGGTVFARDQRDALVKTRRKFIKQTIISTVMSIIGEYIGVKIAQITNMSVFLTNDPTATMIIDGVFRIITHIMISYSDQAILYTRTMGVRDDVSPENRAAVFDSATIKRIQFMFEGEMKK